MIDVYRIQNHCKQHLRGDKMAEVISLTDRLMSKNKSICSATLNGLREDICSLPILHRSGDAIDALFTTLAHAYHTDPESLYTPPYAVQRLHSDVLVFFTAHVIYKFLPAGSIPRVFEPEEHYLQPMVIISVGTPGSDYLDYDLPLSQVDIVNLTASYCVDDHGQVSPHLYYLLETLLTTLTADGWVFAGVYCESDDVIVQLRSDLSRVEIKIFPQIANDDFDDFKRREREFKYNQKETL